MTCSALFYWNTKPRWWDYYGWRMDVKNGDLYRSKRMRMS